MPSRPRQSGANESAASSGTGPAAQGEDPALAAHPAAAGAVRANRDAAGARDVYSPQGEGRGTWKYAQAAKALDNFETTQVLASLARSRGHRALAEQGWRFGNFPQQRGGHMISSWNQALLFALREEPAGQEGGQGQ